MKTKSIDGMTFYTMEVRAKDNSMYLLTLGILGFLMAANLSIYFIFHV